MRHVRAVVTDDFLGRREIDALGAANEERWAAHEREHHAHDAAHTAEREFEQERARHEEKRLGEALGAHGQKHASEEAAVQTALNAVDKLAVVHADAHYREHLNHEQRHADQQVAVSKAEAAVDKRLETMNGYAGQMREQSRTFATADRVDTLQSALDRRFVDTTKHTDDRYEENRRRIEALEKGDVSVSSKAEGRSLGQGAVLGIIVTAIGVAGTLISIIVVLANIATGKP